MAERERSSGPDPEPGPAQLKQDVGPAPVDPTTLATSAALVQSARAAPSSGAPRPPSAPPSGPPSSVASLATVLALQRSVGNRATSALLAPPQRAPDLQRQAEPVLQRQAAAATPSFQIPIEPDATKIDLGGKASYIRGSVALKGEVKGELVPTGGEATAVSAGSTSNKGVQGEVTLAEQKAEAMGSALFDSVGIEKVKETLAFELSAKKLELALGAEASIKTRYPEIKGVVGAKLVVAGLEWETLASDPGSAQVFGLELSGGVSGEKRLPVMTGYDVILTTKVVGAGEVHPNWPRIVAEVGKRAAAQGGRAAVTATTTASGTSVVAIDLAAVGSAAAAIIIPLAAAAAMGYGAYQGMKNTQAAIDGANYGVQLREEAAKNSDSFAKTLTGAGQSGDVGSTAADNQIQQVASSTGAPRDIVIAAAGQQQGGYGDIYAKNRKRVLDEMYRRGVATWEAAQPERSWYEIENLGEDWGARGVFRTNFRLILYHGS